MEPCYETLLKIKCMTLTFDSVQRKRSAESTNKHRQVTDVKAQE